MKLIGRQILLFMIVLGFLAFPHVIAAQSSSSGEIPLDQLPAGVDPSTLPGAENQNPTEPEGTNTSDPEAANEQTTTFVTGLAVGTGIGLIMGGGATWYLRRNTTE